MSRDDDVSKTLGTWLSLHTRKQREKVLTARQSRTWQALASLCLLWRAEAS